MGALNTSGAAAVSPDDKQDALVNVDTRKERIKSVGVISTKWPKLTKHIHCGIVVS